jgi:hypothetical protein
LGLTVNRDDRKAALADRLRAIIRDNAAATVVRKPRKRRSNAGKLRIEVQNVSRDRVVITIDRDIEE